MNNNRLISSALVRAFAGGVLCTASAHGAIAQQTPQPPNLRSSMLASTSWLSDHLRDSHLLVLQVATKAQYDSAHIPGSRLVTLADVSINTTDTRLWAESQGISNDTRIVVVPYDSTLQSATRIFITLAYMGAMAHTSVLDGGLAAWKAEHRLTTTDAAAPATPASYRLALRPELIAYIPDVERAIASKQTSIIDARLPRFYNGDGGGYPREGHIPTAINVPLTTVSEHGFFKDSTALRTLFNESGVVAGKPVVTYCHIGQQGTLLWFVATMLGYEAKLYDGSFQEWSGTPRLPVAGKP
jgi:thiosulfate/3-mercaptopyruvate sulfurtransferase